MTDYINTVDRLYADWLQTAEANLNTEAAIVEALQRTASDLEVAYKYADHPRASLLERKRGHLEAQLGVLTLPEENAEDELDNQPAE